MFQGELYERKEDAPMGSPVSLMIAKLFIKNFEQRALDTSLVRSPFWERHTDDILVIIREILQVSRNKKRKRTSLD